MIKELKYIKHFNEFFYYCFYYLWVHIRFFPVWTESYHASWNCQFGWMSLLHSFHLYEFFGEFYEFFFLKTIMLVSPAWVLTCLFKGPLSLKAFEQILHLYGFSPVWTLSCFFKPDVSLHTFAQYLHLYGLSPVWILSCLFKSDLLLHALEQVIHLYGLSSKWMKLCLVRPFLCANNIQRHYFQTPQDNFWLSLTSNSYYWPELLQVLFHFS